MSYLRYNTRRIPCLRYISPISPEDLPLRRARKCMGNLRPFSNLRILITTKRRSVFDRKQRRRNTNTKECPSAGIKGSGRYGCVPPFTRGVIGHEIGLVLGRELRPL